MPFVHVHHHIVFICTFSSNQFEYPKCIGQFPKSNNYFNQMNLIICINRLNNVNDLNCVRPGYMWLR